MRDTILDIKPLALLTTMEYSQSLFIFISLFFLLSLFLLSKNTTNNKNNPNNIHISTKPYPILGHLPQYINNRHRFNDGMTEILAAGHTVILAAGPTNTFTLCRPGNMCNILTADPANAKHILKSNFHNFPPGFLCSGLFNSDGDQWKIQRKIANTELNTRSLRDLFTEIVQQDTATELLPLLNKCADNGEVLDIQHVLGRYAFNIICKLAFSEVSGVNRGSQSSPMRSEKRPRSVPEDCGVGIPVFWRIKKLLSVGSE